MNGEEHFPPLVVSGGFGAAVGGLLGSALALSYGPGARWHVPSAADINPLWSAQEAAKRQRQLERQTAFLVKQMHVIWGWATTPRTFLDELREEIDGWLTTIQL